MNRQTIVVPEGAGGRVDRFVADVSGLSRSYVQKLISAGELTHDGRSLRANTTEKHAVQLGLDIFATSVQIPNPGTNKWPAPDARAQKIVCGDIRDSSSARENP